MRTSKAAPSPQRLCRPVPLREESFESCSSTALSGCGVTRAMGCPVGWRTESSTSWAPAPAWGSWVCVFTESLHLCPRPGSDLPPPLPTAVAGARGNPCGCVAMDSRRAPWASSGWGASVRPPTSRWPAPATLVSPVSLVPGVWVLTILWKEWPPWAVPSALCMQ